MICHICKQDAVIRSSSAEKEDRRNKRENK